MKVVAVVGSPHKTGNCAYLVDEALKEIAKAGIETEKISLAEVSIAPCQGHEGCAGFKVCKIKDDGPEAIRKFNEADAVILASPVYFYDVTAQMKSFIDRNYFTFTHEQGKKAKTAGLIAIGGGGGGEATLNTLKAFIHLPEKDIFVLEGYTGQGSAKDKPALGKQAREMGKKIAGKLGK